MTTAVRETHAIWQTGRVSEVARLARAGLLYRRMNATEFWALMDQGYVGEGSYDHIELMEGEIVVKPTGRGNKHEAYKAAIVEWMIDHRPRGLTVGIEPTIDFSNTDVLEPDIVLYPRGRPTKELKGPEIALLIEIADSSIDSDTVQKARRYATLGVAHYWVVDVTRALIHVFEDPEPGRYTKRQLVERDQPIIPPFENAPPFRLADLGLPEPAVF